jgi:hypothetical protein
VEEEKNGITERTSRPFGFKTVAVFERLSRDLRQRFYTPMWRVIHLGAPATAAISSLNLTAVWNN